jgi:exodeoxyribonuclease VIII
MHTMIDLETLGTGSNALILSLGAVKFDPLTAEVIDKFHVGLDLDSLPAKAYGFDIEPGTVGWWIHPDRAPGRDALVEVAKTDIGSLLDGFSMWLTDLAFSSDPIIWGNGANFDNVILRNAYEKLGLETPWHFWNDRCYRTLKKLAPSVALVRARAHHSALDDALSQAVHMQAIVAHLNLTEVD